jgi:protein TonB
MSAAVYVDFGARQNWRFALCLPIVLAAHASLGLALLLKQPPPATRDVDGPAVVIELPPISASQADAAADIAQRLPASDAEPQKQPVAEKPTASPDETAEAAERRERKVEQAAETREPPLELALAPVPDVEALRIELPPQRLDAEVAPPQNVRREPEPKPEPKPERRKPREKAKADTKTEQPRQRTAAAPERAPNDARPVTTRNASAAVESAAQRATEGRAAAGASAASAATAAAVASWQSRLSAHLNARKRYPQEAAERNERGVAYVRFSLDREGRVLSSGLARSSGSAALDRETLDLIRRAQPMPAPPAEDRRSRFDISVPIHFTGQ